MNSEDHQGRPHAEISIAAAASLNAPPRSRDDGSDGRGADESADGELLTWWQAVMDGFHSTQESVVTELAQRFNLSPSGADVMLRLFAAPDHRMPMTHLANGMGMSSGGFTRLADRLCTAALARRVACDADRRVTYLELTDHGTEVAQAISRTVAQVLRARVLAPLGRDGFSELAHAMHQLREADNDPFPRTP
jgi:DNA-binding MarR family transcriptional regulator